VTHKAVICERCANSIQHRNELLTRIDGFGVYPYHIECVVRESRDTDGQKRAPFPLNNIPATLLAVLVPFVGVLMSLLTPAKWLWLLSAPFPLYRLYSWYIYERHLKR
jgi:hypothetical protein